MEMEKESIKAIAEQHKGKCGSLISMLEDIQSKYGYLPEDALTLVSEITCSSLTDIYGVATFYKLFSLKPRGKHLISVCLGTACHVRGGQAIAQEFSKQLGIHPGDTTPDHEFSLETVACVGACALGPIVVVDGNYFSKVSEEKVADILEQARFGMDNIDVQGDKRIFPLAVNCPRCNHSLMDPTYLIDGYHSIKVTVSFGNKHGWLRLSSLYGSYSVDYEYPIPEETIVNFFCPHCHTELSSSSVCPICAATMVPMIVRDGGVLQICSRRGCKGHMLDFDGASL
jgi:NADH:ubiquinone oxidoreductase subunit E